MSRKNFNTLLATAFGVHGLTCALITVTGLLILRETSNARTTPWAAAQPA
ncbi:hypothetical protein [Nocardia terpenica]|nr:hypothetical protein [Nocardia terpenica]